MQIARTETLPIDENVLIGLKGMFCNQQKKFLIVSPADFTYFQQSAFSFKIPWNKGNQNCPYYHCFYLLACRVNGPSMSCQLNGPAHIRTIDACSVYWTIHRANGPGPYTLTESRIIDFRVLSSEPTTLI